jgi:FkbM family methyltransferase
MRRARLKNCRSVNMLTPSRPVYPDLHDANGGPIPGRIAALRHVAAGTSVFQRVTRRAAARLAIGRLPDLVARYPDGRTFRVPGRDSDYAAVVFYGEYEPAESRIARALLRPGDFAVDVGANLGWYSILMNASVGSSGVVWAFEPVPDTRRRLEENLALNPGHVVEVHSCALTAAPGTVQVHMFHGLPHGHASVSNLGRADFVAHDVQAETLDRLISVQHAGSPSLVKVDAEGAELDILRGASELCASDAAPIWMIEANREAAGALGYEPGALIKQLRTSNDYAVYRVTSEGLVAERHPERAHGVTWTCVPAARADAVRAVTVV